MGKIKEKRNKYQHHTKMILMCRVCLTQSNNVMFKLEEVFEYQEGLSLSYLEALEKVTASKVVINGDYPEYICPVCTSILKMSFKFVEQFDESQRELRKRFNNTYTEEYKHENTSGKEETAGNAPNVELIFQNNKFNINDLLVVENNETENCDFQGFLGNLGKEVTATFAEKIDKKVPRASEKKDVISLSLIEKDRIIPVHHLQIDEDANLIEYIIDDPVSDIPEEKHSDKCSIESEESAIKVEMSEDEENKNIEYIKTSDFDQDTIDSLIIDRTKLKDNSHNETSVTKNVGSSRKRKKKAGVEDEFEREIKFPCEICQNIFPTAKRLRIHLRKVHFPKMETFTCEICGVLCRTRSAFVHHRLKHGEKQFKCHLCDKAYRTKSVLKVHMETHENKRQHLCSVCGKGFNYPISLTYHMRLHTGEKNYHCEFCPKRFRMPNSLNRHRRTHTGDRPYECQYCSKTFFSKTELTCHQYIHTGFRPYHCKYCQKGFSKTHNLKVHLLSHRGEHHCELCGKSFIDVNILMMHYKISHKDCIIKDEDSSDGQRENGDYSEYKQACKSIESINL